MYRWVVYLHIVGVFGFLTAHGVSVAVAFRLRKERDPARILVLHELSGSSMRWFYISIALLLGAGVLAGFMGGWWDQGWIWTALAVLVATGVAMGLVASPYYKRIGFVARALASGSTAVSEEQFTAILTSRRPYVLAGIGFGATLFILWLMMFKPF